MPKLQVNLTRYDSSRDSWFHESRFIPPAIKSALQKPQPPSHHTEVHRNDEKSGKNIPIDITVDSTETGPPVRRAGRTIEACAAHFVRSGVGEILCPDTDAPAKRTSEPGLLHPDFICRGVGLTFLLFYEDRTGYPFRQRAR